VKFPGDIWVVEIWAVKTGLRLRLGLGFLLRLDLGLALVLVFELVLLLLLLLVFRLWLGLGLIMTVQFMTVQIKTVNHRTAAPPPLFGPCLLSSNGWMDQDVIWYGGTCRPRSHCVTWEPSSL